MFIYRISRSTSCSNNHSESATAASLSVSHCLRRRRCPASARLPSRQVSVTVAQSKVVAQLAAANSRIDEVDGWIK